MYHLPSLPAVRVEKQIIHVATVQFLADWQVLAEPDACAEASRHLATIIEPIRILPRDQLVKFAVDWIVEKLITDIRQGQILDLRHKVSCARLPGVCRGAGEAGRAFSGRSPTCHSISTISASAAES